MPTVAEGVKGRAKLFDTLQRTGAHFIAVGSGSSCDEESDTNNEDIENHGQEGQQNGELDGLGATARSSRETRGKRDAERRTRRSRSQQQRRAAKQPSSPDEGRRSNSMSVRYSRVTTGDGNSSPITEAEQKKRRRSQLADRISNKLHALLWVLVGAVVAYQTDFVRVLMEDERVNRLWFNVGVICFSINVVIMAYLTVWLPHVKGIKVSWNVYTPRAIPTATVVGLICALALNVSLWNVWGFLTPLILFAVFVGCLFSLHFIPWPC